MKNNLFSLTAGCVVLAFCYTNAQAACSDISYNDLLAATKTAASKSTGGYGLPMWATFVDETGKVCAVVTNGVTGSKAGNSEWLGSRVISAQKANTANAFSLDGYAISTANLYSAVSSGSLFGLQFSNPVVSSIAYLGDPYLYGTPRDPLVGKRPGGVNVFGGGVAVYSADGKTKVGAIGVSGDTSCRDHAFAWQMRGALGRHPAGTGITTANYLADGTVATALSGATKGDEMVLTGKPGDASANYWNLWAQPYCPNSIPAATSENGTLQVP